MWCGRNVYFFRIYKSNEICLQFAGLFVVVFLGMQISDLKTLNNQTPFLLISSLPFFQHRQIKPHGFLS